MSNAVHVSSPHLAAGGGAQRVMLQVAAATLPGLLALLWFFGPGTLFQVLLCMFFGVLIEALCVLARGRPPLPALRDCSALLSGLLLGLSIPPLAPWWISAVGMLFAIGIAKQLYGGLGANLFNPAMVGYVVLLISFPVEMTQWSAPAGVAGASQAGFADAMQLVFTGATAAGDGIDGYTMATALDVVRANRLTLTEQELLAFPQFDDGIATGWFTVNLAFLAGGIFLLWRRLTSWHAPVAMLGTIAVLAFLFHANDPDRFASPLIHLFSGATMFGAFFIATDPVSCATSARGRLYFGIGVGCLLFVIRTWGSYPDAVAFAVLLMNLVAPLLDQYTIPRAYGHGAKRSSGS